MLKYKKLLVITDGSENAEMVGKYAISLADLSCAEIISLNVIDTYYLDFILNPSQ